MLQHKLVVEWADGREVSHGFPSCFVVSWVLLFSALVDCCFLFLLYLILTASL